jgi:hypothetical protein
MLRSLAALAWEGPQTLLGAATWAAFRARGRLVRTTRERGRIVSEITGDGAVSLGLFVFYTRSDGPFVPVGPENRDHELGHARQSALLGPLYLPIVGVPSTLRVGFAIAHKLVRGRRWGGYYDGFPERWADALGGVDRSLRPPA